MLRLLAYCWFAERRQQLESLRQEESEVRGFEILFLPGGQALSATQGSCQTASGKKLTLVYLRAPPVHPRRRRAAVRQGVAGSLAEFPRAMDCFAFLFSALPCV